MTSGKRSGVERHHTGFLSAIAFLLSAIYSVAMFWLDPQRGHLSDYVTQLWVRATGRQVDLAATPWLSGPTGPPTGIGLDFFHQFASDRGLEVRPGNGLIQDFSAIIGPGCAPAQVSEPVRAFYQETSRFEVEAWSEWAGLFKPLGWLLALIFSRRLQQLNVPLSPLDTSHGIISEVVNLVDPATSEVKLTAWVRRLVRSQNVLYAGAYSTCAVPGFSGTCLKVVFPLPNGNAIVIMYPQSYEDGSLMLTSSGNSFGDPGFYFSVNQGHRVWARHVRAFRESIHVYSFAEDVRADHVLHLFGITFLRLHYRLRAVATSALKSATVAMPSSTHAE